MDPDFGALYRDARLRICDLADGSNDEVAVPGTPGWRVHDVIAHLSGIAEDAMTGNMEGAPGPAWTGAQVERGRHRTLDEMKARWGEYAAGMEGFLSSPAGAAANQAVMDIHTHECDVRHAVGAPIELPEAFLDWAGPGLLADFQQRVENAGLPAVTIEAPPIEVLLGRMGRRTAGEICALGWSADPQPYLDEFIIFGIRDEPLAR